jgi:hypothetical protein
VSAAASRFRAIRNAPTAAIVELVRPYVEGGDWDRPHRLLAICWDGTKAWIDQDSQAPLSMNPDRLGMFISRRAEMAYERHRATATEGAAPTLYAAAFVMESFSVAELGPDASQWENARMQRDRRERRYHEREDAVERRTAWVVDIDRRLHCLDVSADQPGEPMRSYTIQADGTADGDIRRLSGSVIRSVLGAALAWGVLLHGDPMAPQQAADGNVVQLGKRA